MGQNQINKVRKNLTKGVRDKKRAFKRSTNQHPTSNVAHVNSLVDARNNGEVEGDVSKVVLRRAKLGKNNAFIRPTEMSKKKLHLIAQAMKLGKQRLISKGLLDASMDGEDDEVPAPKSKRRGAAAKQRLLEHNAAVTASNEIEEEEDDTEVQEGKGTLLGKPGVMF